MSVNPFPNKPWILRGLQDKSFENTEGKGEIARNEQFLLFPQCFLPNWITLCYFHQIYYCRLQTLSVWKSLKLDVWERVNLIHNPFPNKPWFLRVCSTSLLKTPWEKEKMLVTSNLSSSHSVFYPSKQALVFTCLQYKSLLKTPREKQISSISIKI